MHGMAYDSWQLLLSEKFPPRDPALVQVEWDAMKQRLAVGQTVSGTVVAKADFGAWLDIGIGFPALIFVPDVAGLAPDSYINDQWCPPVGSAITAEIVLFADPKHVVRVSQRTVDASPQIVSTTLKPASVEQKPENRFARVPLQHATLVPGHGIGGEPQTGEVPGIVDRG